MKIHNTISLSNTILFTFILYLAEFSRYSLNLLNFFIIFILFFLSSNFLTKFLLIPTYERLDFNNPNIMNKKKSLMNLHENSLEINNSFQEVFNFLKTDILDFLVKAGELKREEEKAKKLSEEVTEFNKNLESLIIQRTKELRASKEVAEVANKTKSEFLAKISHEMRTPLTPIIGYSKMLKNSELDLEVKNQLEIIHRSGVKLLNFTNELLDFSKIEVGKIELKHETFLLNKLIGDIYHEHLEMSKNKGLSLTFDLSNEDIYIYIPIG